MAEFVNKPFAPVVEPIKTSSHTFKSGIPVKFTVPREKEDKAPLEEKIKDIEETLKQNKKGKVVPKLNKKQITEYKNEIKRLQSLKKGKYKSGTKVNYYKMSLTEFNNFKKELKEVFPKGLERKYFLDKNQIAGYSSTRSAEKLAQPLGKIDPRGGGMRYKWAPKKTRGTEEEFKESKEHYARLVAGFCEVVAKYWELSPYIKNPKCKVSSHARGFGKKGRGNHDFGHASDSYVECSYGGKKYIIPVLQYWNSINLLIREGRLPNSKVGLYLNIATTVAHDTYTKDKADADKKAGVAEKSKPIGRVKVSKNRVGLTGARIDQAGTAAKSRKTGAAPGSSGNVHYDFQGFFGVYTVTGRGTTNYEYLDLDLSGDGGTNLYASQGLTVKKYNEKKYGKENPKKPGEFIGGRPLQIFRSKGNSPHGGWKTSESVKLLKEKAYNREGIETLSDVANYFIKGLALKKGVKTKISGKNGDKWVSVVPYDNFLHKVDERVPNILQVLGLEGEEYVKQLGLDK